LILVAIPGETARIHRDGPVGLRLPEKGLILKGRLNPGRRIATSCLGSPRAMCRITASLRPYPLKSALFRQPVLNVAMDSRGFAFSLWLSRGNGRKSVARRETDGPTHRLQAVTGMCQTALAPFGSGFCGHFPEIAMGYSRGPMLNYSGVQWDHGPRRRVVAPILMRCRLAG
jgi:hypothetical protein